MKRFILFLIFLLGALVVFYFSWKGNPDLEESWWMPHWVVVWGNENFNLRTAVPFVGMGLMLGYMIRRRFLYFLCCWLAMVALVVIAEVGQLYLPGRSFDFWDIFYGVAGGATGILTGKVFKFFVK